MKALSLWQPWSTFMADGKKLIETRGWETSYRGELVICSAKRKPSLAECGDQATYDAALKLPFGFALCVVDLYDIVPTRNFINGAHRALLPLRVLTPQEAELGDYTPGRFGWMTRRLFKFQKPVPVVGRQSLFDLSPDEERLVREQCGYIVTTSKAQEELL